VPVDDDCGLLFLDRREDAIMVGVEEVHDLMEGLSAMVVPEDFCMNGGVAVAKVCGKLHFGVLCVIPTNKASNKPNDDRVSDGGDSDRKWDFPTGCSLALNDVRCHNNNRGQDKKERGELPVPRVSHATSPASFISVPLEAATCNYTYDVSGTEKDSHLMRD
jgi:hypothetical protein